MTSTGHSTPSVAPEAARVDLGLDGRRLSFSEGFAAAVRAFLTGLDPGIRTAAAGVDGSHRATPAAAGE
ncbi:hypothetical protein [Streptomyces sp. cmx-18-6]|uniref:hypothetical protein n=1 Tax=Streptomyces sp. cmx-18-6 TaxID=2790930 RepID=UPI0039817CB4